jgi:hypothetical protein
MAKATRGEIALQVRFAFERQGLRLENPQIEAIGEDGGWRIRAPESGAEPPLDFRAVAERVEAELTPVYELN